MEVGKGGVQPHAAQVAEPATRRCGDRKLVLEAHVTVSRDCMEARLAAPSPAMGEAAPELADVVRWLEANKVVYGVCTDAITVALAEARAPGVPVEDVVVAKGTPPKPGEDARVEFYFGLEPSAGSITGGGDRIDYHERGFLHSVCKGDLLARKIPATPGEAGRDVYGRTVPARPGKDVKLAATGEAVLSEDGLECRAGSDGVVVAVGSGKVGVFEKYTVPGDVDLHTGNLHMKGVLVVRGWVRAGFQVHATGDLMIGGGIEPSIVKTDANLEVEGGVVGGEQSTVDCGGSLGAQYIENASVCAGGDVTVRNGILNSQVTADGRVIATQGKGYIIGGTVRGAKGVEANELGSRSGLHTVVDVGVDSATRAKLAQMERDCALYARNRQKLAKVLVGLIQKYKSGQLLPAERKAFAKLVRYRREMESIRQNIANCWKRLETTSAAVKVHKAVYEGVTVFVSGRRLDVSGEISIPGEFVLNIEEGRVNFRP